MKGHNGRNEDGSITGMSDGSLSLGYALKFQKEAQNLARLDHSNIVHVTDFFEGNGTFYYVMDYIEGFNHFIVNYLGFIANCLFQKKPCI